MSSRTNWNPTSKPAPTGQVLLFKDKGKAGAGPIKILNVRNIRVGEEMF